MKIAHPATKEFIPATHEDPANPGVLKKVLFSSADFDPECGLRMLNYAVMRPGESFARHSHETLEEVFYILSGRAQITIGEEVEELGPEMAVIIPRATPHQMKNVGGETLVYLAFGGAFSDGKTIVL